MADHMHEISADLAAWWLAQPVFFVATAPLSAEGHVNLSPKGLDTLRILGPRRVTYLDLTGSGAETIAHIRENQRVTLMACAFTGPPRISRIHGSGAVHPMGSPGFAGLRDQFPDLVGVRSVIDIAVDRVSTSCGYAVPTMELVGERDRLVQWANAKGEAGIEQYWGSHNRTSIDGLPALERP